MSYARLTQRNRLAQNLGIFQSRRNDRRFAYLRRTPFGVD
jgi:hypothetical protein